MSKVIARLDARMRRLPDPLLFAVSMVVLAALGVFKATSGRDVPVFDFLLVVVTSVAWLTSWWGYAYSCAMLAAAVNLALAWVHHAPAGPALVSFAIRLVVYVLVIEVLRAARSEQVVREAEARVDHTTGAANIRGFNEAADGELRRSRRYRHPLSLLYLDIDDFKAINDRLGHEAGDKVLLHVSHILRTVVRGVDTVGRLGGDEFGVLLPETDAGAAATVARRVRQNLARVLTADGAPVTYSIGLVTFTRPPADVAALVDRGDRLMYRAKAAGKDRLEQEDEASEAGPPTP